MSLGIFAVALDFSEVAEDEFHDWYDHEHNPERLRIPGFRNASRWIGSADPKISVALYDLDAVDVLRSPPFIAIGGKNGSPWTKRVMACAKRIMRYEGDQLSPGDVLAPTGATALLLVSMNVAPEYEAEFNEWYDAEHLPALAAVPGVLCARRYSSSSATQRYLAVYHLASRDVPRSSEWEMVSNTRWSERIKPHLRDYLRIEADAYGIDHPTASS